MGSRVCSTGWLAMTRHRERRVLMGPINPFGDQLRTMWMAAYPTEGWEAPEHRAWFDGLGEQVEQRMIQLETAMFERDRAGQRSQDWTETAGTARYARKRAEDVARAEIWAQARQEHNLPTGAELEEAAETLGLPEDWEIGRAS